MRVDQAFGKRDLIKNKNVVIVGYFGTASNQNEYLVLNQKNLEIVFDRSIQSIQLKNGASVTSLDEVMRNGFNNVFLDELIKVKGVIRESEGDVYIENAIISFPLLEEKMRMAEIYGLISGNSK